jgi:hypothetical protein
MAMEVFRESKNAALDLVQLLWANSSSKEIVSYSSIYVLDWEIKGEWGELRDVFRGVATLLRAHAHSSKSVPRSEAIPKKRGAKPKITVQKRRNIVAETISSTADLKDNKRVRELCKKLDEAKLPVTVKGRSTMAWTDLKGALLAKAIETFRNDLKTISLQIPS